MQSADATLALSTMDANYTDRLNEKLYNVESRHLFCAYSVLLYCVWRVLSFHVHVLVSHECGCAIALDVTRQAEHTGRRQKGRTRAFIHTQYLHAIFIEPTRTRTANCTLCLLPNNRHKHVSRYISAHTHTMWLNHTHTRCERTRLRLLFCDVFIYFLHTHFFRCSYHLHGHRMYDVDGDDDASTAHSFASQFVCCFMFMWFVTQTVHIRQSFLLFSSRILMQNIPLIDFTVCLISNYTLTMRHHDQTN